MEVLIPITLFICVAAVAILRPISTRLGGLLDAVRQERTDSARATADLDLSNVRNLLEHVSRRMDIMEERLDFTERLLHSRQGPPSPSVGSAGAGSAPDPLHSRDTSLLHS